MWLPGSRNPSAARHRVGKLPPDPPTWAGRARRVVGPCAWDQQVPCLRRQRVSARAHSTLEQPRTPFERVPCGGRPVPYWGRWCSGLRDSDEPRIAAARAHMLGTRRLRDREIDQELLLLGGSQQVAFRRISDRTARSILATEGAWRPAACQRTRYRTHALSNCEPLLLSSTHRQPPSARPPRARNGLSAPCISRSSCRWPRRSCGARRRRRTPEGRRGSRCAC